MRSILIVTTVILTLGCGASHNSKLRGVEEDNERLANLIQQRTDFLKDFRALHPKKKLYSPKKSYIGHFDRVPGIYKINTVYENVAHFRLVAHDVTSENLYLTMLPNPMELVGRLPIDQASRIYSYLKTVSRTKTFGTLAYGTLVDKPTGQSWQAIFNTTITGVGRQDINRKKHPLMGLDAYLISQAKRSTFEILLSRFAELKKIGAKFRPLQVRLNMGRSPDLCAIRQADFEDLTYLTLNREAVNLSEEKFNALIDHIVNYGEKALTEGVFIDACNDFTI